MNVGELGPVHVCCGSWPDHRYRCAERVWPATATPEIRRQAVRGDCIAPAHAQIEDLVHGGMDYQQRKRLTEVLAQVWDDGFGYSQQVLAQGGAGLRLPLFLRWCRKHHHPLWLCGYCYEENR